MIIEKHKANSEREICLCGLPIVQYGTKKFSGFKEKYCDISPKSFEHVFLDKILDIIGTSHDLVCLIRANGNGEAYLICLAINELIEKYNAKNPCIVFHRKIFEDVIKVFQPNITMYYTENLQYNNYCNSLFHNHIRYKGIDFLVMQCPLKGMKNLAQDYLNGNNEPYPIVIKKIHNLKEYSKVHMQFSDNDKSIIDQVGNLNIDNFVFFIPEANCVRDISEEFWTKLAGKFRKKGIDVFVNTKTGTSNYGVSTQTTISQAMYLASLSKGIIAIRSGFSELVSTFPIQKHIIYPYFKYEPITPKNMIKSYSITTYPEVDKDKIFEYDTEKLSEDEIIEKIIRSFR